MRVSMPVTSTTVVGALVLVMAGCTPQSSDKGSTDTGKPDSATSAAVDSHVVTVTAKDYAFDAPAEVTAGPTTFHLVNTGHELHHITLLRLGDGKTAADLTDAMKTQGPPPTWISFASGPNAAGPGGTAEATVILEPGNYVMVCFIPGPDGVSHISKGMMRPFTVVAPSGTTVSEPKADITLALSDYAFTLSPAVTAGPHVFRVTNGATQPHEAVLVKMAPGKKGADLAAWIMKQVGPPPGEIQNGLAAMSPGAHAYFPENLTPGNYAWICFLDDAKDGKPHFAHGMIQDFTVS